MTIKQYKKLARANAQANGTSYQAELNAIAHDHGHSSWGPFQAALKLNNAEDICPVRSFIESLRVDEETKALVEDALHGYLAENGASIGASINDYVEGYEFRGDEAEVLPDEDQRIYIKLAIARYLNKRSNADRRAQESRLRRAIEAFQKSHPAIPPLRLAKVPILPEPLTPDLPYRSPLYNLSKHAPRIPLPLKDFFDDHEEPDPIIRPVHPQKSPSISLRPVSAQGETQQPEIHFVKPYSPPAPSLHLKPVEPTLRPWPKLERVETPQERDRKMEEDYQRTKTKMDRLQEKLARFRSGKDDDTQ